MTILKRLLQYKIYRKMIASYFFLVTVTVLILSLILFMLFSSRAAKEIDSNSKLMLAQTSYTSDVVYTQVVNITNQLINNTTITSFFYAKYEDKIKSYDVSILLSRIQNVYPFIKYIEICNIATGTYYNTLDVPESTMDEIQRNTMELIKNNKKGHMVFLPRKFIREHSGWFPQTLSTLSFAVFPDYLTSSDTAILINIDEKYIQRTIQSINGSSPDFITFVMDKNGLILSHTNPDFFMQNISDLEYVKKILKDSKSQGSLIQNIDSEKKLVTYVKSNTLNWYFVSVKPYTQLIHNIYQLRNIILAIAFFLVIIGILVSTLLTRNIYNPINSLMEKVHLIGEGGNTRMYKCDEFNLISEVIKKSQEDTKLMHSSISNFSNLIKQNYILNILKGGLSRIIAPEEIIMNIEKQIEGPYFCAILFKIDNFNFFKCSNKQEDQSLLRFAICNIAQELLEKHFKTDSVITEEDEVVILAQLQEESISDDVFLTLADIQDTINRYFKFSLSIGIGDIVPYKEEISLSYKSCVEYIKYRLFYGYECIIDSQKIINRIGNFGVYPHNIEKKLIDAIQLSNCRLVQKYTKEFVTEISSVTYYQAINYSNRLILSVLKQFESTMGLLVKDIKTSFDAINGISSSETILDLSGQINDFCIQICELLNEKNTKLNTLKYEKITADVKEFVLNNYNDPGLSLEKAADIVGLSSGYLGKLFKSITNTAFSDYLNSVRLEKAKELLLYTSEPASKICEKVGIYNITYFSTLFKKTYGMTPSNYRDQSFTHETKKQI